MKERFETFNPQNAVVKQYVDYYYLDIKPHNEVRAYQCFPHFNNTLSLYASHYHSEEEAMVYQEEGEAYQIFTPIREEVLEVKQIGKVHRIVLVFHPFGIQQFYKQLDFAKYITDYAFLSQGELDQLFATTDIARLTALLDVYLMKRFEPFSNSLIEKSLTYIFDDSIHFSIQELADTVGCSRQHLNRVFKLHLGVSIKKFYAIYLFRKTVSQKLDTTSEENLTHIAHRFNFNDQSHLIKTYQAFTQHAPTRFFEKGTKLGDKDTFWHLK